MILILLFLSDFWLCILNLKDIKHLIKDEELIEVKNLSGLSEELMLIAWNSKTRWNFLVSEDEKKEIEPIFIEEL